MGYIIAAAVFVIGILLVAFLLNSRSGAARGRVKPAGVRPVERSQPSAEEATPSASLTADQDSVRQAEKRTPPA